MYPRARLTICIGTLAFALLSVWALPVVAQPVHDPVTPVGPVDPVQPLRIEAGIDLVTTHAGPGADPTYMQFDEGANEIPAGFFDHDPSTNSLSWHGQINLKGVPIETDPPGVLKKTDTIIERLEDALFNPFSGQGTPERTVATIIRALSLASLDPITVHYQNGEPDQWDVTVGLSTFQDQTQGAAVIRLTADNGGNFDSDPLYILPRVIFTLQGDPGTVRVLDFGEWGLPPAEFFTSGGVPWATETGAHGVEHPDPVEVDTNNDGVPDTSLPGTSNFHAGWRPDGSPSGSSFEEGIIARHKIETLRDLEQQQVDELEAQEHQHGST